ncbi:MAG: hypothetical protein QM658_00675 [Gordonia sp. (in: high G+C Gram-positive bacteria)]
MDVDELPEIGCLTILGTFYSMLKEQDPSLEEDARLVDSDGNPIRRR